MDPLYPAELHIAYPVCCCSLSQRDEFLPEVDGPMQRIADPLQRPCDQPVHSCLIRLQRDEFLPEVTMDPMRGPRRMDGRRGMGDDDEEEEDEFEDEQDPFMP